MLVIEAENDATEPSGQGGELLAREFPERVRLVRIPAAGHALLPEQGDLIRQATVEFLKAQRAPER